MRGIAGAVPLPLRQWAYARIPAPVWRHIRDAAHGRTAPQRLFRRGRMRAAKMALTGIETDSTMLELRGQAYVAVKVDRFRSSEVIAHHLALVADALDAHEVPYFVLDAQAERRRVVVVSSANRRKALAALHRELAQQTVYLAPVKGKNIHSPRLVGRRAAPRTAPVLRLFRVLASPSGGYLGGPELGCDLEFWQVVDKDRPAYDNGEPVPAGTLRAPRPNPWVDQVTPDEQATEQRVVDGETRPVLTALRHPHLMTLREPIDVVYTWVDGSDPEWILRKADAQNEHLSRSQVMHALAANDSRYMSRDELRYSLRSLDMYADWVRHVYLVTDDQVPPWLDTSNPRITVVSHRELFGNRGRLPTFNSHAIESQLHHIEGLSEHYLYLNDDVFFGRPISPSLFFHGNGLPVFYLSKAKIGLGPASPDDMPVMSAAKQNRDLVAKMFDRTISNKFKHVPHALRRSVMADMEQDFAADFERTASSQFRSHADVSISASLGHYYGYATGRAVPGEIRYFYADIARENTPAQLDDLLADRDFDVFCLNDHDSSRLDPETQAQMIGDFLSAYFPLASSFERT